LVFGSISIICCYKRIFPVEYHLAQASDGNDRNGKGWKVYLTVNTNSSPCPEGYHTATDDETGQCYPDTQPCWPGQVRNQTSTDPKDRSCRDETIVCKDKNYNATACVRIDEYPDKQCLTSPDRDNCNVPSGGCSGVFVRMDSVNFSSPKCVPDDRDQLEFEERTRQVYDPNRCARGYELDVPPNTNVWRTTTKPLGQCLERD
jgi:hypothetical protein